jgi:hypothetical protein
MTRRTYLSDNPRQWNTLRESVIKGLQLAVDQRASMSQKALVEVLEDRDRRFYRALLVHKLGAAGYHLLGRKTIAKLQNEFKAMMTLQEFWGVYLEAVQKGMLRFHFIERAPRTPEFEFMIEDWIWMAEYIIEVCKKGDERRWTMEALELGSAIIDEGCVKVEGDYPKLIKTPTTPGWRSVAWW